MSSRSQRSCVQGQKGYLPAGRQGARAPVREYSLPAGVAVEVREHNDRAVLLEPLDERLRGFLCCVVPRGRVASLSASTALPIGAHSAAGRDVGRGWVGGWVGGG